MNAAEKLNEVHMVKNSQETRIALLEQSQVHLYETLLRIEKRFDQIDEKFTKIDDKFDKVNERFDKLYEKLDSNNKWLIGLAVSVLFSAGTLGFSIYNCIHKFY